MNCGDPTCPLCNGGDWRAWFGGRFRYPDADEQGPVPRSGFIDGGTARRAETWDVPVAAIDALALDREADQLMGRFRTRELWPEGVTVLRIVVPMPHPVRFYAIDETPDLEPLRTAEVYRIETTATVPTITRVGQVREPDPEPPASSFGGFRSFYVFDEARNLSYDVSAIRNLSFTYPREPRRGDESAFGITGPMAITWRWAIALFAPGPLLLLAIVLLDLIN